MRDARAPSSRAVSYFQEIRRFPMLKADDEYVLALRWRENGDGSAAHQLLTSHLRLVAKIAIAHRRYGLPTSDLISEGNIGLLQAIKRFDPDKGVRFSTYAIWWIKAAIKDYIMRSWSLVKMGTTGNQKKLFFNLPKAKRRLSALQDGDLRPDQVTLIANDLGVTERDVVEMNRRLSGDVEEGSDQESRLAESEEYETRRTALGLGLTVLDDRERDIFEARRLVDPPITLEHFAMQFHISRERVRQIETRAFKKVQRAAHAASERMTATTEFAQVNNLSGGALTASGRPHLTPC